MILEVVDVLEPGPISFSSVSSSSKVEKNSENAFLESLAAEILLEECLTIQQA